MRLLLLSHCAPDAPDKGEKVRACHLLRRLSARHELHVACFARRKEELEGLESVRGQCASLYAELLDRRWRLARSALPFLAGGCLNVLLFRSRRMARHVEQLAARQALDAAVVYTVPMAQYVPAGVPFLLDMQDVDSEKWRQYAARRFPGLLYAMEAARYRREEIRWVRRAHRTYFVTRAEEELFRSFCRDGSTGFIENGWSAEEFDADGVASLPELKGRRYLAFAGTMNYFPNVDGVVRFAREVLPELRRRDPSLELLVVGRDPAPEVRALGRRPGIVVTGAVADAKPYLKDCLAAVAPLEVARGVQMKAIEALMMGKPVLASPEVAQTFGELPPGVMVCRGVEGYWAGLRECGRWRAEEIRAAARARFDGMRNLETLERELEGLKAASKAGVQ